MAICFKRSHAGTAALNAPTLQQATTDPRLHHGLLNTHRKSGSVSCRVTVPFSWVLVHSSFCFFPLQESVPPDLCKFWWLYVGVNCDLLQECLCQTKVYCTQSPCPHSSPLLTRTSSRDTETQFCLNLYVVSGSWCTPGVFEPSEHL